MNWSPLKYCVALLILISPARAGDSPARKVDVNATPFEPRYTDFFDPKDKFRHPAELIPPKLLFPFEKRRAAMAGGEGEVVMLVQIDDTGFAKKLSVLSGTHEFFVREAIEALKKARWATGKGSVWFYYKATFTLDG